MFDREWLQNQRIFGIMANIVQSTTTSIRLLPTAFLALSNPKIFYMLCSVEGCVVFNSNCNVCLMYIFHSEPFRCARTSMTRNNTLSNQTATGIRQQLGQWIILLI